MAVGGRAYDRKKTTGAHPTPDELAAFVASRIMAFLAGMSGKPLRVLDPACGDGQLLAAIGVRLIREGFGPVTLIGVDTDAAALRQAGARLGVLEPCASQLIHADFLKLVSSRLGQLSLFEDGLSSELAPVDILIANPPYVRTQILGTSRSQALSDTFGLSGRVDLYHAFLVASTCLLKPGSLLGVITSNRFLYTKAGQSVRQFLASEYDLLEIYDLGDTRMFSAAVLPAVLIAKKRAGRDVVTTQRPRFLRVYEQLPTDRAPEARDEYGASVYDILQAPEDGEYAADGRRFRRVSGTAVVSPSQPDPWRIISSSERKWLAAVDSGAAFRLGDLAKVRVGIKTTADSVFIRGDWDALPEGERPEPALLREVLSHRQAGRWQPLDKPGGTLWVLYPHEMRDGKRCAVRLASYPRAARYLEQHRKQLESREYLMNAGRNWYELWVPQDPGAWRYPKVFFPDISPEARFCYDDRGRVVGGDCYWISVGPNGDQDLMYLILGVANSRLLAQYHDLAFQNRLYSGRRRYLTQYCERYPLPDPKSGQAQAIVELAKQLIHDGLPPQEADEREKEIDDTLASIFHVSAFNMTHGLYTEQPS